MLCLESAPLRAAPADILAGVTVGFAGRVRTGAWTPVWIDIASPAAGVGIDGTVTIDAPSPTGTPVVRYATRVRAAPGARVRVFLPAIFYDSRTPGTVHLDDASGRLATLTLPRLRPVEEIVVVLSNEPVGVEPVASARERAEIAYISPEALPQVWQAYEAVRLLVVRTLDDRRVDDAQREAIRRWVWTGGALLAMPAGDDLRHLRGPTLLPILPPPASEVLPGEGVRMTRWRAGRGRFTLWDRDGADPAWRGAPGALRAWEAVFADLPPTPAGELESTLAAQRPVPVRTHVLVGGLILIYVAGARIIGRLIAAWRPAAALTAVAAVAVATVAAARLAVVARHDASGLVASIVVEAIPGTGHGLVTMLARTVLSHGAGFNVAARGDLLMRPVPPAQVSVVREAEVIVRSGERNVRLAASAVVPLPIAGTLAQRDGGVTAVVTNRSGSRLEKPWIYAAGRVQSVPDIEAEASFVLDEQRWQPRDRLHRTEPNHALLLWAFSHLESDAILKTIPAWLVGWLHDPALGLRWGGRLEATPQLILIPLTAP